MSSNSLELRNVFRIMMSSGDFSLGYGATVKSAHRKRVGRDDSANRFSRFGRRRQDRKKECLNHNTNASPCRRCRDTGVAGVSSEKIALGFARTSRDYHSRRKNTLESSLSHRYSDHGRNYGRYHRRRNFRARGMGENCQVPAEPFRHAGELNISFV